MKKFFALVSFLIMFTVSHAQPCTGLGGTQTGEDIIFCSSSDPLTQTVFDIPAGNYVLVYVCSTNTYTFTTCNSLYVGNTEISVLDEFGAVITGAATDYINDNTCGTSGEDETLVWTPPAAYAGGGFVQVVVSQFDNILMNPCQSIGSPSDLDITASGTCAPPGTCCDSPISISGDTYASGTQSTCGFINDYDDTQISCPAENFYLNGDDYVVAFTPTSGGYYEFEFTAVDNWMGFFVLNGCPSAGGGCVYNDGIANPGTVTANVNLSAGVPYFIIMGSNPAGVVPPGTQCGEFILNINPSTPGVICEVPFDLADGPYPINLTSETTCGFGDDYSASNCSNDNYIGGEEMVFTLTPSVSGCYRISLTAEAYSSVLVLDDCPDNGGACIGWQGSAAADPSVDVTLTGGSTYYIIVSSWPPPDCVAFDLSVDMCPIGSVCSDPFLIASAPFNQAGLTTCGLANDYNSATCDAAYLAGEDWVATFTPTTTGCYTVDLTGTSAGASIMIMDDCPDAGGVNCIGWNGTAAANPTANGYLEAGTTYYFIVSSTGGCTDFDIDLQECTQIGEDCSMPITLNTGASQSLTTCGAGDNYDSGDACMNSFMNGEDLVFTYTPASDGCYDFVLSNASDGTASFGLFILDDCPDGASPDCVSEGAATAGTPTVTANLIGGTTYTVVVASTGCSGFDIVVNSVTCPIGNECANPLPVGMGLTADIDMNASGDDYEPSDACGGNYMGGNDYVMEFTAPTTDCYNFATSAGMGFNPDADLGIFILDGCPDAAGTNCLAFAELENGFPEVDATLSMGETYFIVIGAIEFLTPVLYSNSTTVFDITITDGGTMCPSGANCGDPFIVNVGTYTDLTSCGYGNDYGNGDGCSSAYMIGEDFVMSFTPAVDDCYDFITSANMNSDPTDDLGLFVLDDCPDSPGASCLINATEENGFPSGSADLMAGQTYYILVTGVQVAGIIVASDCATSFDFEIAAGGTCPVGLDCYDPFDVTIGTYNNLTSCGAIDDYGSGDGCGSLYMVGEDVVFTFTPPATDCYNIATSSTPSSDPIADVGLFVLDDCPDAPGVSCLMLETQDNGFPSGDVELNGGQTYYIIFSAVNIVDGGPVLLFEEYCTDFNLEISIGTGCPVAPNDCPFDATDITPLIGSAISQPHGWECDPSVQIFSDGTNPPNVTNVNGDIASIPCDISSDIGERNDVWYKFTMDASFNAWIDLYQNQGSDLVTLVYEASPGGISGDCFGVNGLSYVGCADDANGLDPVYDVGECTVVIHNRFDISSLTPGTEYYIRIIVDNGGPGVGAIDFNLCVEQGFTVPGASDGCNNLPDGGSTPQIACPTGAVNVNIDTTLFNQSNAGAFGNEPADCNPNNGVLATAAGNGDIGCTGTFSSAAYINNVVNNNVHYSFEVNGDAGCLAGADVTITFSNAFSNGGAFQIQVVEGICPSGGSALMALSTAPPGNGCFAMQNFIPNGQYYIVVDGQDGALLGYDIQVEIVYDGPMCELGCCYPPPAIDPIDLTECDDGLGSYNFDLTSLDNEINGGSGDQVNWYEDVGLTMPIADPTNFTTNTGITTVYATVFDGTCESDPVAIDLILYESPTIDIINSTDATCGFMNGELEVIVSGGSTPYSVNIGGSPMVGNGPSFTFTGLASGSYTATVTDDNGCTTTQVASINDNPGPMITVVVTDAMCGADGEIEVTVSSGTGPFTVDIGGGNTMSGNGPVFTFTGLIGGDYSIDVEDANLCNTLENVTIGTSPGPSIDNINASNSSCGNSDGSAQVTISGDDPPFTVLIDGNSETGASPVTVNGLSAGTYDVLVTDVNGCTALGSVTINDDMGPTIDSVTPTDATCGNTDGSAVVTITGNGDFTVTIDGQMGSGPSPVTVTGLSPGTHTVDVVDVNGCTTAGSVIIGEQESPTIGMITTVNSTCGNADGEATVTITGGTAPYTLVINGMMVTGASPLTITGLGAGSYDVDVTDSNGCTDMSTVSISDDSGPVIDSVTPTDATCGNTDGSAVVTITGNGDFTVTIDGQMGSGPSPVTVTGLSPGTHTVDVVDVNGCTTAGSVIIGEQESPTIGMITTVNSTCGNADGEATVTITGGTAPYTLVINGMMVTGASPLTITGLAAGSYDVDVTDSNGCTDMSTVSISDDSGPVIDSVTPTDATCGNTDGSAVVTITGNGDFTVTIDGQMGSGPSPVTVTGLSPGTHTVDVVDVNGCTTAGSVIIGEQESPTIGMITTVNSTCGNADGEATVTITGGTAPYTLVINGMMVTGASPLTITGLAAGSYDVDVTDSNGCTDMSTVSISDDSGPVIDSVTPTDATCGNTDGSAVVTITGNGDFTVTIDGQMGSGPSPVTVTGLSPGTHTVDVVDVNGCTTAGSVIIGEQESPTIGMITTVNSTCGNADGEATVTITGGTAPYTLVINGMMVTGASPLTITGLAAGSYDVDVTDSNGCTDMSTVSISDDSGPVIDSVTPTDATCGNTDGSAVVTITGNGDFTVTIDGQMGSGPSPVTVTGLSPGTHTVDVEDVNGCTTSGSVIIGEQESPTIGMITTVNSTCGNADGEATVTITGGTAPYTLVINGMMVTGASPLTITGLAAGSYDVDVTDSNGCTDMSTVSISDDSGPVIDSVTPTDATCGNTDGSAVVTITGNGDFTVTIDGQMGSGPSPVTVTGLSPGTHTVDVEDINGCTTSGSVIIGEQESPTIGMITTVNSTCGNADGEATVTITGGTAPYTLVINGMMVTGASPLTITGLAAGSYDVDVTDSNGCTDMSTVSISDDSGPVIDSVTPTDATCGNTDGSAVVTITGNGDFTVTIDGQMGSGPSPVTVTGLSPGTHTVDVEDVNGCTTSGSVIIGEQESPTIGMITTVNSTCGNADGEATVTITGGTAPYTLVINGMMVTGASPLTITGLAAGSYDVDVTDSNGCTDMSTVTIMDDAGPMIDMISSTNSTCGQSNGTATVTISGGTAPYTLDIDGQMMTGGSPLTITGLSAGTYPVEVEDANGCMTSGSVTIMDEAGPVIDMVTPTVATCGNTDGMAEVTITGGTPDYTLTIDGQMATGVSPLTIMDLAPGLYTVEVEDANGCVASTTVTIGEQESPTIDMITPTNSSCGNADGSAEVTISGGLAPYTVDIDTETSTSGSPVTVNNLGAGTYVVSVTDANGCTVEGMVTISDDSGPVIDMITPSDATCGNTDGSVEVVISGGTSPYTLTVDGQMVTGASPLTIMALAPGTYTVDVSDANGCMTSGSVTIGEQESPTIDMVTSVNSSCGAANGSATVTVSGGTGPYTVDIDTQTNTSGSPVTVSNLSAGTYTVSVTDANGCTVEGSVTIADDPGPTLDGQDVTDATCGQSNGSVTINITGGANPFDYDLNGMTQTNNPTFTGLAEGSYPWTVTDANGCELTGTAVIGGSPEIVIDDIVATNETCGQMDGTATINITGGTAPITYTLNAVDQIDDNTYTGLSAGTYTVDVEDANGCTATGSVTIEETDGPMVDDVTTVDASCGQMDGEVTITISGGLADYDVLLNSVTQTTSGSTTFTGLMSGSYPFTVTDANGCTATGTANVTDADGPVIDDITITDANCGMSNGEIVVTASGGSGTLTISLDGGSNGTDTFSDLAAGTYTIEVADENGCIASQTATVADIPGPTIDDITTTESSCSVDDGTAIVTISGGSPDYSVTIGGESMSGSGPDVTVTGLGAGSYTAMVTDADGCTATMAVTIDEANPPSITSIDVVNENCGQGNGSLSINVSGGMPVYTYDIGNGSPQVGNNTFIDQSAGTYAVTVTDDNGCTDTQTATITDIPGVAIDMLDITDSSCGEDNGQVTVILTGGSAPFTYDLAGTIQVSNPTFTGLAMGDYALVVTDANGCTDMGTVTIGGSPGIIIDGVDATNETCGQEDGTATINITGGTAPITYTINTVDQIDDNVFTDFSAGTYVVSVEDANGCTDEGSVTIEETDGPMIDDITEVNATCGQEDGSATISVSGGLAPYDVVLNSVMQTTSDMTTFTGLASGNYTVLVTDQNGCTAMGTANITDADGPVIDDVMVVDANCDMPTGSVTILASGGAAPLTIRLDGMANGTNTFNNLLPGDYAVEVEDANGCVSTTTATVGNIPGVEIDDITTTEATCGSDGTKTVTFSGGTAPYNVTCGSNTQTTSNNFVTFTGLASGTYTVIVTDANGCTDEGTGVVTEADAPQIDNAAVVDADCGMMNGSITVNASGGVMPYMYNNGGADQASNVFDNLGAGSYDLVVTDANGCTATLNAVVNDLPGVEIDNIETTPATCGNADGTKTINVSGGTPPYTYNCNGTIQVSNNFFDNLAAGTYAVIVTDANGCEATETATISDADGPQIDDVQITDASCGMPNGGVIIIVSGGTAPYSYTVNGGTPQTNNSFTGLSSGTATILVVDANGCNVSQNVTIGDTPEVMIDDLNIVNANCDMSDGGVTVILDGGTAPFTYDLDGMIQVSNSTYTGLPAGDYDLLVTDANGCTAMGTVSILNDPGVVIDDVTIVNATCGQANGSLTVLVSGGSMPYSYQINGGASQSGNLFSGLVSGSYTILVTDDNGCTDEIMVTIDGSGSPVIDDIFTTGSTCGQSDGTATIFVSGGTGPYTYTANQITITDPTNVFIGFASGNYPLVVTDANGCTVQGTINITDADGPVIDNVEVVDALCGNATGSVTVDASGGTAPLTISLNGMDNGTNMFSNLLPGTYNVQVVDANGCIATSTATVGDTPGVNIDNLTTTEASCGQADGSITIIVSDGTSPITYQVGANSQVDNNVFNNLPSGTYDVMVTDANGCTDMGSVTIEDADGPVLDNFAVVDALCGNSTGSVTLNVSGGTPPYTYSLGANTQVSNVFDNLAPGSYDFIITDANECTLMATIEVGDIQGAVIDDIETMDASCNNSDGSLTVNASGGTTPYSYNLGTGSQASNIFPGLPAGFYSVTVTDANGCTDVSSATINDSDGPAIDNVVPMSASCGNSDGSITISISGGTTPYEVTVGAMMMTTSNNTTFSGLSAGNYTADVVDANGCTTSVNFDIDEVGGVSIDNIIIVDASCNNADGSLTVEALMGMMPYTYDIGTGAQSSNVFMNLASGTYTVTVTDDNGCTDTEEATINDLDGPTIDNVSEVDATCGMDDGSVTISVSGGTGPYDVVLDGNTQSTFDMTVFSNLAEGVYPFTVTDANGCETSGSATIGGGDNPIIDDIVVEDATCNNSDGTLTVEASGGVPPYMYNIGSGDQSSNVFTGLASGNYTVTVTGSDGCSVEGSAIINDLDGPTIDNVSEVDATCGMDDGSVTISVSGGTGPYDIVLDGNTQSTSDMTVFSNLAEGVYPFTVTDANGCETSGSATIGGGDNPIIDDIVVEDATCNNSDGTLTVEASGGVPPYMYNIGSGDQSSNVFTGLASGNYTVTVTGSDGCSVEGSATINDLDGPTIDNVSEVDATCGMDDGSVTISVSGGTGPYDIVLDGNTQSTFDMTVFSNLAEGVYPFTVTDANGCETSGSATIGGGDNPIIDDIVVEDATCNNSDGTLTVEASGGVPPYMYNIGSGDQSSNVFTGLASGNYTVTVTGSDGCSVEGSAIINDLDGPTIDNTSVVDASAGGSDGEVTVDISGGTAPYDVELNGMNQSTSDMTVFTGIPGGTYTVTVTDANGCITTIEVTVGEGDCHTIDNIATTEATCSEANGIVTITVSGGVAPYMYSINGIVFQTGNVFSGLPAGTYTATVTDANDCTEEMSFIILDLEGPTLDNVETSNATCGQSDGMITVTASGGNGNLMYSIDGGSIFQTGNLFTGLSAGAYDIVVIDENDCMASEVASISNDGAPSVTASVTDASCGNADGTATAEVSGGTGPFVYTIGSTTQNGDPLFENLAAGNYILEVLDANNCIGTVAITIDEVGDINIDIIGSTVICSGGFTELTASPLDAGYDFVWSTGETSNSILVTESDAGTISLMATIGGCTGVASVELTVAPTPNADAGPDAQVDCDNPTVMLDGSNSTGDNLTYNWTTIGGNILGAGDVAVIEVNAAGTYTLEVTSVAGCTHTDDLEVSQGGSPVADAGSPLELSCNTTSLQLDGTNSTQGSELTYLWTSDMGQNIENETTLTPTVFELGVYTLTVTNTTTGCTSISTVTVTADNTIPSSFNLAIEDETCIGNNDGTVLILGVQGGEGPYLYSFDGGDFTTQFNYANIAPGSYVLAVMGTNGCAYEEIIVIQPGNDLTVNLGPDQTTFRGTEIYFEALTSIDSSLIVTLDWSTDEVDNTLCGSCFSQAVIPDVTTTYTVEVTDENGCYAIDEMTVFLRKAVDIYMPNAFSPDGDGINDLFFPSAQLDVIDNVKSFLVYDRWGNKVFENNEFAPNDPTQGWDGRYNGEYVNSGVFVYVVIATETGGGPDIVFKGDVAIVK